MGCIDLREWIALLEKEGELHRITLAGNFTSNSFTIHTSDTNAAAVSRS